MKRQLVKFVGQVAAFSALVVALPGTAHAATLLDGKALTVDYWFPNSGDIYDRRQVTVGSGVEVMNFPAPGYFDVDVSDKHIAINNFDTSFCFSNCTWSNSSFNGLRFFDHTGTIDSFVSASVSATNMLGLDASRLSFDANNIYLNWQGLTFSNNTFVELDLNGGSSPIPEPASIMLLGTGVLGLVARNRRRRELV